MKEKPKCEVSEYGNKVWYLGERSYLHREDGPAVEWANGDKEWWSHAKRHREDGPAIERGGGRKAWYLHHEEVHPEQIVDLHLSRGIFCYYNEETRTLHFDEIT